MDATTVAVDLAEDIFEVVAVANRAGRIIERKRLTRRQSSASSTRYRRERT